MRALMPVLVVTTFAAIVSAQSSSITASSSNSIDTPSIPAGITECNTTQLDEGQVILTSNQRANQCEEELSLQAGTMLQVTTGDAIAMCDTASCRAALQELYNGLPNCRYNLWGLQYSAKQLLEYCGITPTNTNGAEPSGSLSWSIFSGSGSESFAPVGAIEAPTTTGDTTADSPTQAQVSSAATPTTTLAALVAAFVAAYMA